MRAPALFLALIAAGCGGAPDDGNGSAADNQIERLSVPRKAASVPQASARPMPLTVADVEREGMSGAGCSFTGAGKLLLAATQQDALARIEGALVHFVQTAAAGPSGGFFEDRQISISVGRTGEIGTAAEEEEGSSWPARLTVTNRRTGAQLEMDGIWSCGA